MPNKKIYIFCIFLFTYHNIYDIISRQQIKFTSEVKILYITEEYIDPPVLESNPYFSVVLAGITRCNEENVPDDEKKLTPFSRGNYQVYPLDKYHVIRNKSEVASIEFIISGSGTVKINGKEYHPKKNDTLFLKLDEHQEFYSNEDKPWVKIWFSVEGSLVKTLTETYGLTDYTVFHCNIKSYIERVHSLLTDKTITPKEICNEVAICLHEVLQVMAMSIESQEKNSYDAEAVKHYIDMNVYSIITVEQLAKLIYKSPSQTIRIFKQHYNMTPYDYYIKVRIETAISLLKNTTIPIREIASKLQFSDEHYFSYFFKQKTGKKPTDFRKQ